MVLHYATPLLERYAVPFTLLRERVDEEILGPCRLGIAWLPEVLRWPEHCKVGVRGREILPKPGVQQVRMELLDGVQGVCYQPEHEVRVSAGADQRVGARTQLFILLNSPRNSSFEARRRSSGSRLHS